MKSYEEMAQSVINRAKIHRAVRRRWITSVAAVLCVCVVSVVAVVAIRPDNPVNSVLSVTRSTTTTTPTHQTPSNDTQDVIPQSPGRVTLVHMTVKGNDQVRMREDVKLPYRTLIRIRDITGISEAQMPVVYAEEEEYIDRAYACYSQESRSWGRYRGENVLITTISVGQFVLRLEDINEVESVRVGVTDVGYMGLAPHLDDYCSIANGKLSIQLNEEGILKACDDGIVMSWGISPHTAQVIKDNPSIRLSDFQDTITITVGFKDGTVENHVIDMVFDDLGEVYAIYRGVTESERI